MTLDATISAPGRPRDARIDDRVLQATRAVLAARGFDGATVQAIASRARVHTSAIYRRWPSRIEIIEQAVFPGLSAADVRPTGNLPRDLRRFVRSYLAALGEPAVRAAMPHLLALYQGGREAPNGAWLGVSARPGFVAILAAAQPGTLDAAVDPDDVFDVLLGAMLARVLVPTVARRERPAERLVELVLRLLRPCDGSATRAAT
ncbi:MAG: TetR/AcrR family transcriptional regulator [Myxococcales bacterium]|nr:TetR/AcrR family transcriptional regulator [Myxococcales bacterium]